ncbi:MAG: LON peptidase substrate-binding domain-containing protein [Planctomycetaceae bacterium]
MAEHYGLPDDFNNEVRLFPLRDLVLFPSNVQPLHLFEERYRELVEDAMMTDKLIAVATLKPGYDSNEYFSRPPVDESICVGQVANCERTEQGTYNLLLVGLKRAVIEDELPPHRSFREAKIRVLDDDIVVDPEPHLKTLRNTLVDRLQRLVPDSKDLLAALMERELTLAELTDVLAFHINLDTEVKLKLLREVKAERRAEIMLKAMPNRGSFDDGELPPFSMN